jgi:hypothetical protein
MVNIALPGRPFGDELDRYPRSTRAEAEAAAVQASRLRRCRDVHADLSVLYRRLIERRGTRREWLRSPTDARIAVVADRTGLPMLTLDELLVRSRDLDGKGRRFRERPMRELLTAYDLVENRVAELDNRVTRLRFRKDPDPQRLAELGGLLRRHGYQATMNYCVPLGPIVKSAIGDVGPEPSDRPEKPKSPDLEPTGSPVAVLDTGITRQRRGDRWLESIERVDSGDTRTNNIDPLYELGQEPVFDMGAGHGSFVAGVIQQVDPTAEVRVIKVLGADGLGGDVEVAVGILLAVEQGARILNLSLGTETADDQPPLATLVALELLAELREKEGEDGTDVVLVAAAGNNGDTRPIWPAAFSALHTPGVRVVSVAGLMANYEPAEFSTHGFWVSCSTAANGVLSPFVKGRETPEMDPAPDEWAADDPWAVWTGTSFAAPQVAGAIARVCGRTGDPPSVALDWLLAQGVWVPDYGRALRILPVS